MSSGLDELIDFVKFTNLIRNIQRAIILEDDSRRENDMEHMYQLALVALFIIDTKNLKLDKFRCVGMALMHDVCEGYAGDVSVHAAPDERKAHFEREKQAIAKIKRQWPKFSSFSALADEYEEGSTPEAKFVYALDKVLPVIQIYLYDGRSWKDQNVSYEDHIRVKIGEADVDPTIAEYYESIKEILVKHPGLFADKK